LVNSENTIISVYPNPVTGKTFTIKLNELKQGNYTVKIFIKHSYSSVNTGMGTSYCFPQANSKIVWLNCSKNSRVSTIYYFITFIDS